jgi:hypothetical protein
MATLSAIWTVTLVVGLLASLGLLGPLGNRILLPVVALFILIGLVLSLSFFRFGGLPSI